MASSRRTRFVQLGCLTSFTLALGCNDRLADGVTTSGVADDSGTFATADEIGESIDGEGSGSGASSSDTDSSTITDSNSGSTTDSNSGTATDSNSGTATDSNSGTATDTNSGTATDTNSGTATDTGTDTSGDTSSDSSGSDSGSSDTGMGGCVGACGTPGCGDCPPDGFVDFGDFGMAATEATVAQYTEFLAVDFDLFGLPDTCSWKDSFTPDSWGAQTNPDLPVVKVDWCDAWAYCTWSGGHMCGLVGGEAAALADFDDPDANEWFAACTDSGAQTYPYGNAYDGAACNGVDKGIGSIAAAGSLAGCEGGKSGIFDLSGNVWEWESGCADSPMTDDANEDCRYRGGSYFSGSSVLRCAIDAKRPRSFRNGNTGIRCCSTP